MSSATWTPGALSSEARSRSGECWRFVEAQHHVSTLKLTDTLEEQEILEGLLERSKPPVPPECGHLHFLLAAPFRYAPYPNGSRFRRPGFTPGVYYAAEEPETAAAEMAFYRLLFFAESPATPWPANPAEFTAFAAAYAARRCIDLQAAPFDSDAALWVHPTEYGPCQDLAEAARAAGVQAIRYRSVRDPRGGAALAILTCTAFASPEPVAVQSWRIHLGASGARALREFPRAALAFDRASFVADPRIAGMAWER